MKLLKNILLVLSTGYIFVYFSEHLFWARIRPDDSLGGWLGAWVAYTFLAFVFLTLIAYFKIKNIWSLFLAGAAFGWLAEGVIVQTTYEFLPLSISFTGLAWHALITIWIGWYALRKSFFSIASFSTVKLSAVIGACYGLWAIAWWSEPDGGVSSLVDFAAFSLVTTILVILAYGLANWSATEPFLPDCRVTLGISLLFILYFLFVAVPAAPLALIILPLLLGLVYFGLRRTRLAAADLSMINELTGNIPVWNLLGLLAVPVTGILVYWIALSLNLHWHTNWILYLIATPLGFILFGLSLYKSWRNESAS